LLEPRFPRAFKPPQPVPGCALLGWRVVAELGSLLSRRSAGYRAMDSCRARAMNSRSSSD
jgi:hypothetical protein